MGIETATIPLDDNWEAANKTVNTNTLKINGSTAKTLPCVTHESIFEECSPSQSLYPICGENIETEL